MRDKKFVHLFVLTLFGIIAIVIITNYIVDPLFTFKHIKEVNINYKDVNERLQKTNYLKYVDNNFDALLLGNSRVSYINTNDFNIGYKIFNYSINALSPLEYETIIDHFIFLTGKNPKIILIGIDLFSLTMKTYSEEFEQIFKNQNDPLYRYKNLVSFDTFLLSVKNIFSTIQLHYGVYDRKQRFYNRSLEKGSTIKNAISNKEYIELGNWGFSFSHDLIMNTLQALKTKYKHSQFIIFTPPIHSFLLKNWSQNDLFLQTHYKALENLVDIFGEVHHFLYFDPIFADNTNFYDVFHFYPYIGSLIANHISNEIKTENVGILLNKNNIHPYLNKLP